VAGCLQWVKEHLSQDARMFLNIRDLYKVITTRHVLMNHRYSSEHSKASAQQRAQVSISVRHGRQHVSSLSECNGDSPGGERCALSECNPLLGCLASHSPRALSTCSAVVMLNICCECVYLLMS
jgi:hypothetical protein